MRIVTFWQTFSILTGASFPAITVLAARETPIENKQDQLHPTHTIKYGHCIMIQVRQDEKTELLIKTGPFSSFFQQAVLFQPYLNVKLDFNLLNKLSLIYNTFYIVGLLIHLFVKS